MLAKADLDRLARLHKETGEYLDRHDAVRQLLDNLSWAFRTLCDLVPQTREKLFSGHFFPITQAEDELQNCGALAHIGFYQHAIAGLRWVLELGMLSVYWDRADDAEQIIQEWLRSKSKTPFQQQIRNGLQEIPNIALYCEQSGFLQDFEETYLELSKYQHTKGVRYSSRHLSGGSVIRFNEVALVLWAVLAFKVVRLVTVVHLLKYPVGLQETLIDQKFGLNPLMGGFLNPWQADRLRSLFGSDDLATLQAISDADPEGRKLAEQIASMPDITTEQREQQELRWAQDVIENQGFESWFELAQKFNELTGADREAHQGFREVTEELRVWATKRGLLERGRHWPVGE